MQLWTGRQNSTNEFQEFEYESRQLNSFNLIES